MAVQESYLNYIVDQLEAFGNYESKKMFGGVGFFRDGIMFGMIGPDVFRLRVDDKTRARYEAHGMEPYYSGAKKKGMPYWQVPEGVLADKNELKEWAEEAFQVALRAKK